MALFLTPLMIFIAKKYKIFDVPSKRKSHETPMPLLGGVAICLSVVISIAVFVQTNDTFVLVVLLAGAVGVSFMGLIDDIIALSAARRILILLCISFIVFFGSVQYYFSSMVMLQSLVIKILFSAYIIIWILGVTNAINFSDGLDGLASYLSLISVIAFAIIFSLQGRNMFVTTITIALAGGIAGFIPYNRSPAMVFMGDAGSMFIGFMLGLLSITSIAFEHTLLSIIVPAYLIFVPIMDMYLSILRRIIQKKSIMMPDKLHFHHLLNNRFNNHLTVVTILSLIQVVFAAMGIVVYITKEYIIGWVFLAAITIVLSIITIRRVIKDKKQTADQINI